MIVRGEHYPVRTRLRHYCGSEWEVIKVIGGEHHDHCARCIVGTARPGSTGGERVGSEIVMHGEYIERSFDVVTEPRTVSHMVREFHEFFGLTIRDAPTTDVPVAEVEFREDLHREEFKELQNAMWAYDLVGVADGLADCFYVLAGTALHYGLDLDAILAEVHRSNMTKEPSGDGNKKAVKGPAYSPPNLDRFLGDYPDREAA